MNMVRVMKVWRIISNGTNRIWYSSCRHHSALPNINPVVLKTEFGKTTPALSFATSCHRRTTSIAAFNVDDDKKRITLKWNDGEEATFHSKWLRFNCRCSKCHDNTTSSWMHPTHEIPLDLTIKSVHVSEDGHIHTQWNEEDHDGILTSDYLQENSYSKTNTRRLRDQAKMQYHFDTTIPEISWTDVEKSEDDLYRWLRYIGDQGICLLTDVPPEHNYMSNVMKKIGPLTESLYGEVADVKIIEKPINPVHKSVAILFHMDLAIYEAQPGIQGLHCLRFDDWIRGGETLFVDMYHVADEFRKEYPDEFRILTKVPVAFTIIHYNRDEPVHMVRRRPLIYLNDEDEIINITWHEHEMGAPLVNESNVEEFYRAYQLFARSMHNFPHKIAIRLRQGHMICFNNRRFAHARNAFSGEGGVRHLQGAYVNTDEFKSKLMYMSQKLDGGRSISRVGNNDWT